ncbi:hypothetical protein BsWGS_21688 [Bradybaena similaris]
MEADSVQQRSRPEPSQPPVQPREEKQIAEEVKINGRDDQPSSHRRSPLSCNNDKLLRPRQKNKTSAIFQEDVIDGFAILSFKTLEDLTVRIRY